VDKGKKGYPRSFYLPFGRRGGKGRGKKENALSGRLLFFSFWGGRKEWGGLFKKKGRGEEREKNERGPFSLACHSSPGREKRGGGGNLVKKKKKRKGVDQAGVHSFKYHSKEGKPT